MAVSSEEDCTKVLLAAVEEGDEARVRDSLAAGADPRVTVRTTLGQTNCMVAQAARHGHAHLLPCLLQAGLSVDGGGDDDRTPLMLAAKHGHTLMVKELLDHGAKTQTTDNAERTALSYAAQGGHEECVSTLLSDNLHESKDKRGRTAVHYAAEGGRLEMVKQLVGDDGRPFMTKDKDGFTPLDLAMMNGRQLVWDFLAKKSGTVYTGADYILRFVGIWRRRDVKRHRSIVSIMKEDKVKRLTYIGAEPTDFYVIDNAGLTPLHHAARHGLSPECVATALQLGVCPRVLTPDGNTPADLAELKGKKEVLRTLQQHKCEQTAVSLEEMYEELMNTIIKGDDVKAVSKCLCKGAPLRPAGTWTNSPLRLAVILDRRRTVTLLLASGAVLPASLLQEAWQSPGVTPQVLASLTATYICRLQAEKQRVYSTCQSKERSHCDALVNGIKALMAAVEGDAPWNTAWPTDKPQELSALMAEAGRANCPVSVAFLHRAGAWSFSGEWGAGAMQAAMEAGNTHMLELLIRDLESGIYVDGRLPEEAILRAELRRLEQHRFQKERARLEDWALCQKSEREKTVARLALKFQKILFDYHEKGHTYWCLLLADGRSILKLSVRRDLWQLTYLLVQVGRLPVDETLDDGCGTTALHEAAAHGQDSCVALLLRLGADPRRRDRYGQTPRLLAAMFGHKSTEELLALREPQDLLCRAGTTATQVNRHFDAYLASYEKLGRARREALTPVDRQDPERVTCKLLEAIGVRELWQKAKEVAVDFSRGEAREVQAAVMMELTAIVDKVAQEDSLYRGSLHLAGSSEDGSKLYRPDEFDVNFVIAPKNVTAEVTETPEKDAKLKGKFQISVVTDAPGLQGSNFMEKMFRLLQKCLTEYTLQDERLSLVPPGLNSTKVGATLALAWQGEEYPLLLVGVDLVPVLKLPWHEKTEKPKLIRDRAQTFHLCNAADGSWRCSFALTEAAVLKDLSHAKRLVLVMGKVLLSCLKAEPWMPREMKQLCTWFLHREWKIAAPKSFCFKSAFLRWLEEQDDEEQAAEQEEAHVCVRKLVQVFRKLCAEPEAEREQLTVANIPAYFGGEFEGRKLGEGAPLIVRSLEEHLEKCSQQTDQEKGKTQPTDKEGKEDEGRDR